MGRPKNEKKKIDDADPQAVGPQQTENSASSVVELVYQSETNTFVVSEPEGTGTKSEPVITPDAADQQNGGSGGAQETVTDDKPPLSEAEGPRTGSSEAGSGSQASPDAEGKAKVVQSGGTASEGDQRKAAKSEKGKTHDQPPQLPVVINRPDVFRAASNKEQLSDEKVADLVRRVMANRDKADNAALKTGQMLLDEVFGGNLSEACSRNPKKNNSFKSIVEHQDMDLDATTLGRWVKAANLVKTFETKGKKFKRLTCSHFIALLSLKDDNKKMRLAEEAEEKGFSVRRLAFEVGNAEPPSPKSQIEIISCKLGNPKELAKAEKSLLDKTKWAKLDPEDRKTLMTRVKNATASARTYINQLTRFQQLLEDIVAEAK